MQSAGLIDAGRGMISRQIFFASEIYAAELQQIFARCWLFLCHDSQIRQPGRWFFMDKAAPTEVKKAYGVHTFD